MISLEQIGRSKPQVQRVGQNSGHYDHETQLRWDAESLNTRRIYMKSSTSFDGESDQGGDDR